MEKGPFHRNVFDAKAAIRIHVPMPLVNFITKLKDHTIQGGNQQSRTEVFSIEATDG